MLGRILAPQHYTVGAKQHMLNHGVPLSTPPRAGFNRDLKKIILARHQSDWLCFVPIVLIWFAAELSEVPALNATEVHFGEYAAIPPQVGDYSRTSCAWKSCGSC